MGAQKCMFEKRELPQRRRGRGAAKCVRCSGLKKVKKHVEKQRRPKAKSFRLGCAKVKRRDAKVRKKMQIPRRVAARDDSVVVFGAGSFTSGCATATQSGRELQRKVLVHAAHATAASAGAAGDPEKMYTVIVLRPCPLAAVAAS